MSFSISLLIVLAFVIFLRIFWSIYQIYSRQRLRRKLERIQLEKKK